MTLVQSRYDILQGRPAPWTLGESGGPSPEAAIERVATAASILAAIRLTPQLVTASARAAARSDAGRRSVVRHLAVAAHNPADAVTAIAAIHALGAVDGPEADRALAEVIGSDGYGPPHAAWAAADRKPADPLLGPLVDRVAHGGLAGMLAQQTLERWAASDPWMIAAALHAGLLRTADASGRRHLVETMGLVPVASLTSDLARLADAASESDATRAAAGEALDDRCNWLIRTVPTGLSPAPGLRVAQVHLGARLDERLSRSGAGATGGIATLLVELGRALAGMPDIAEVVTIGRGDAQGAPVGRAATPSAEASASRSTPGQRIIGLPLPSEAGTAFGDAWPARVAVERQLRRTFAQLGRLDAIHLRMADVGTLAAANVAAQMDVATVFTLAPDPHALIAERERNGQLDRASFGSADALQQLWYRVKLVEHLTAQASQVALFPRARLGPQLRRLTGVDIDARPDRYTVVPEGIDVASIRRTAANRGGSPGQALTALEARISQLPAKRHGLPLVLSVGRLHPVKGMSRLAQAWAGDARLRDRATLVIVGGDLEQPTADEATELRRIDAALAADPAAAQSVVLFGRRPHGDVAELLVAARTGHGQLIGADGAYACASDKEEFGLAIVEALAAGLPVVAPLNGGPATYVEHGRTGWLVDTGSPAALADAIHAALDIAPRPGRAEHAAARIARDYDVSVMAATLAAVYRGVARPGRRLAA